ncbi:hypothetical protein MKY64_30260 [Paenibacillus sp. FSL R7-0210]|uniref:DUF7667 family protein n=1 Tax=Paenibacillus sp. FSL R7-0210 TaxID=2921676 RepID=UPI0030FA7623
MVELAVLPAHERLAELYEISRSRFLTDKEDDEMWLCMKINFNVMRELGFIKSESQMAYEIENTEWQHAICARIEAISKKFIRGGIYSG